MPHVASEVGGAILPGDCRRAGVSVAICKITPMMSTMGSVGERGEYEVRSGIQRVRMFK